MLKLQDSTATNLLLLFILIFMGLFLMYPFFAGSNLKLDNFVNAVFTTNKNNLSGEVGYLYNININSNYIEPEQMYLYQNDVIKVYNSTKNTYVISEQSLPDVKTDLLPENEYFKKFSAPGVYEFTLVNKLSSKESKFIVYVK